MIATAKSMWPRYAYQPRMTIVLRVRKANISKTITATASVITALAVVIGLVFGICTQWDSSRTKLEVRLNVAKSSPLLTYRFFDGSVATDTYLTTNKFTAITIINHSEFPTTLDAIRVEYADGTTRLVSENFGVLYLDPAGGIPARVQPRAAVVLAIPRALLPGGATRVEIRTADGYVKWVDIPKELGVETMERQPSSD